MVSLKNVVALALVALVGLGGVGPCLCSVDALQSPADPHACCERMTPGDTGNPTTQPSIEGVFPGCAGDPGARPVAVTAASTVPLNAPVAVLRGAAGPVAPSVRSALVALAHPPSSPPLPRSTVLRI